MAFNSRTALISFSVLALCLFFVAYSLYVDVTESGVRPTSWVPFLLLGVSRDGCASGTATTKR